MDYPLTGESLQHARHELRTPINHILGYTEMLLEENEGEGQDALLAALRELHSGGRTLLTWIGDALGEVHGSVGLEQLQAFEAKLCPEAERLLKASEALAKQLSRPEDEGNLADLQHVSGAFRQLTVLTRKLAQGTEETEAAPSVKERLDPKPAPLPSEDDGAGRILVAENNAANRELFRRRLEKEGYRVWEAIDGIDALEMLEVNSYDLLLLDLVMPRMDGFQVLARLKKDARLRDMPVIMISASDEMHSAVRGIEMGAEDFLVKPFDPVLLRARIGAYIERKRLRDRERQRTKELEQALQQLKETQSQLVVQEKMASLGALTAGIAHEIKNPLNFVINFAALSGDLLTDMQKALASADSAFVEELMSDLTLNLQKITEHGKRADSIVRGMLAHSRGGTGERESVDLNVLVAEAVTLAYHGLRAHDSAFNITLESEFDTTLPPVKVIPQELSRVILNIANNACYAAHQKKLQQGDGFEPKLRVTTGQDATHVEVRLRDNGTGIPKSALEKIFNPFFTTKPTGSGTGLGLSLSYQIVVEQHQGNITVNTEEGEYTEFVVSLPK